MWVARNKNDKLILFARNDKPVRDEVSGTWGYMQMHDGDYLIIEKDLFPNIVWESEPQEVCLCINDEKYHTVKVEILDKLYENNQLLEERIQQYNLLPWYKRIFNKI